jgi:hypothetical protein
LGEVERAQLAQPLEQPSHRFGRPRAGHGLELLQTRTGPRPRCCEWLHGHACGIDHQLRVELRLLLVGEVPTHDCAGALQGGLSGQLEMATQGSAAGTERLPFAS